MTVAIETIISNSGAFFQFSKDVQPKTDITKEMKYYYDNLQALIFDNITDKRIRRFCAFYLLKKQFPHLNYYQIGKILCITRQGVKYIADNFVEYYGNEGYRLKESFELLENKLNEATGNIPT